MIESRRARYARAIAVAGLAVLATLGCADSAREERAGGDAEGRESGQPPRPGLMGERADTVTQSGDTARVPDWLHELMTAMREAPPANPPLTITSHIWRGDTVYYVPPRCCDEFGTVYDAGGLILCHPDGGITGGGDERCPAFSRESRLLDSVWSDPRGSPPR